MRGPVDVEVIIWIKADPAAMEGCCRFLNIRSDIDILDHETAIFQIVTCDLKLTGGAMDIAIAGKLSVKLSAYSWLCSDVLQKRIQNGNVFKSQFSIGMERKRFVQPG